MSSNHFCMINGANNKQDHGTYGKKRVNRSPVAALAVNTHCCSSVDLAGQQCTWPSWRGGVRLPSCSMMSNPYLRETIRWTSLHQQLEENFEEYSVYLTGINGRIELKNVSDHDHHNLRQKADHDKFPSSASLFLFFLIITIMRGYTKMMENTGVHTAKRNKVYEHRIIKCTYEFLPRTHRKR